MPDTRSCPGAESFAFEAVRTAAFDIEFEPSTGNNRFEAYLLLDRTNVSFRAMNLRRRVSATGRQRRRPSSEQTRMAGMLRTALARWPGHPSRGLAAGAEDAVRPSLCENPGPRFRLTAQSSEAYREGIGMPRFIEGQDRHQVTLLPESLDDFIAEDNAVRIVDAFVNELDLAKLGFEGVQAAETGRPSYHPTVLLRIYVYGYLNRVQSSRRLERECQRDLELMWLTGRLAPDFKTIADFRRDNGKGIRGACRRFVELCRD
jgi:transposase